MAGSVHNDPENPPLARDQVAAALARGLCRALANRGLSCLTELTLGNGRRVDVIGLDTKGRIEIVEIKSSIEDFKTDRKWPEYLAYCDSFYFAVPEDFPQSLIPDEVGLMVADPYGAEILRESQVYDLNAARRRSLLLLYAQTAARRLQGLIDPG